MTFELVGREGLVGEKNDVQLGARAGRDNRPELLQVAPFDPLLGEWAGNAEHKRASIEPDRFAVAEPRGEVAFLQLGPQLFCGVFPYRVGRQDADASGALVGHLLLSGVRLLS
jgi:hypothetical protein